MSKVSELAKQCDLFRWKGAEGEGYEWDCDPEKIYAFAEAIARHCLYSCDLVGADPVQPDIDKFHVGVKQCMEEILYQFGLGSLDQYYNDLSVRNRK